MTESRSSGSSESLSTELVAKLFNALPDEKPDELPEIEFCLFRLFTQLAAYSREFSLFAIFFFAFSWIQTFACICIIGISLNIQDESPDFATKVFYFCLHLRPYGTNMLSIPFLIIINIICIFCILLFLTLLYLMHKRVYIPFRYRSIIIPFLVDIPRILTITLTMNVSELVFNLISKDSNYNYAQAAVMGVYLFLLFCILFPCSNTMYSSIFYYSGLFQSTASPIFFHCSNIFLLFTYTVTHSILKESDANYLTASCLILFAVTILLMCLGNFFISISYITFLLSHSIIQLISGIISIFEIKKSITDYARIYLINFYLYIICVVFVYIVLQLVRRKYKKRFVKAANEKDFTKLGKITDLMLLNYLYFGVQECHECVEDNSFLDYAFHEKTRPIWVMFRIYHMLSLIHKAPSKFDELKIQIHQNRQISQRQRYMLFEIEHLNGLRTRTQVPSEVESKMSEFEARLSQYQQLRINFMTEIAHNKEIAFIYLNALSVMKNNMLTNYACSLIERYPNSPEVLRLYAQYLSIVCQNSVGCSRWTTIADDIQKRVIDYADYTHVNILSRHPRIQLSMLAHKASNPVVSMFRPRQPSIMFFPTLNESNNKLNLFGNAPNNQFSAKKSYADIFDILFAVIFGIFLFAFIICAFVYAKEEDDDIFGCIQFMGAISDYFNGFCSVMYHPLIIIYNDSALINNSLFSSINNGIYELGWYEFNRNYTNCSEHSETFRKAFNWVQTDTYLIPSYNISLHIESQLEWIFSRYTNLLQQIFPSGTEYLSDAVEVSVFLETISESYSLSRPLLTHFLNSFVDFSTEMPKVMLKDVLIMIIPVVVLGIVLIILPPLILIDMKKLIDYFPKPDSDTLSDHHILHLYLKQDFFSFAHLYAVIIVCVIAEFILTICLSFVIYESSLSTKRNNIRVMSNIFDDLGVLLASSTALQDLLLSQIKTTDFDPNETAIVNEINSCMEYLENLTPSSINYPPPTQQMLHLLLHMSYMISNTHIFYVTGFAVKYQQVFQNELVPALIQRNSDFLNEIRHATLIDELRNMNLIILFFFFISLIYIILFYFILKLHYTLQMLIDLLSGLRESSLNLMRSANLKRNNILDLVARPCVLIDRGTRVIMMNQLWLSYFDETFDAVVGRTIGELANTQQFITYEVFGENKLVVMSEIKQESEAKLELKNTKRDLRLLKSVSIPKRFLDVIEGTEDVGFLVVCKIALIPSSKDDLSPEVWINDATAMEQWLNERCQVCGDYDILYDSFREITILFGVNEKLFPNILVMYAVNIMVDLLRWSIEWEWSSGPMSTCITITCGKPNKFVFTHSTFTTMESFGPPFEKQMKLRENLELNSIVVCDETAFRIKSLKFGFELEECGVGAYIFMIPNYYRADLPTENY